MASQIENRDAEEDSETAFLTANASVLSQLSRLVYFDPEETPAWIVLPQIG